jgi:hypothetical protein
VASPGFGARGHEATLWDEGDGMEATLARHLACWHRRCRNRLLHTTTLSRKRKLEEVAANDCSELLDDTDVNSIDESPAGCYTAF